MCMYVCLCLCVCVCYVCHVRVQYGSAFRCIDWIVALAVACAVRACPGAGLAVSCLKWEGPAMALSAVVVGDETVV